MLRGFLFKENQGGHCPWVAMAEVPLLQPNDIPALSRTAPTWPSQCMWAVATSLPENHIFRGRLRADLSSPSQADAASVSSPVSGDNNGPYLRGFVFISEN